MQKQKIKKRPLRPTVGMIPEKKNRLDRYRYSVLYEKSLWSASVTEWKPSRFAFVTFWDTITQKLWSDCTASTSKPDKFKLWSDSKLHRLFLRSHSLLYCPFLCSATHQQLIFSFYEQEFPLPPQQSEGFQWLSHNFYRQSPRLY